MKQKYIYIAFVLATIFILILINRRNAVNDPAATMNKVAQEISFRPADTASARIGALLKEPGKPSITVIKRAKPKEESLLPETKKAITVPEKKEAPASGSYAASGEEANSSPAREKPAPGVTKIGKRPSQQTVNELNEQGIVLY
ncbi:MAG: hypothetical protein PHP17_00290 [Candidatus Omnitrophica bacterium]|nr:hypothetical protein [Candidatus Omnitrophota bacterium]